MNAFVRAKERVQMLLWKLWIREKLPTAPDVPMLVHGRLRFPCTMCCDACDGRSEASLSPLSSVGVSLASAVRRRATFMLLS